MDVIVSDEGTEGAYRLPVPGTDVLAELTWHTEGAARVIDHTFVPPEARGLGLAAKLLDAALADARAQGLKIIPRCSYAEAQFARHPEWADLLVGPES